MRQRRQVFQMKRSMFFPPVTFFRPSQKTGSTSFTSSFKGGGSWRPPMWRGKGYGKAPGFYKPSGAWSAKGRGGKGKGIEPTPVPSQSTFLPTSQAKHELVASPGRQRSSDPPHCERSRQRMAKPALNNKTSFLNRSGLGKGRSGTNHFTRVPRGGSSKRIGGVGNPPSKIFNTFFHHREKGNGWFQQDQVDNRLPGTQPISSTQALQVRLPPKIFTPS